MGIKLGISHVRKSSWSPTQFDQWSKQELFQNQDQNQDFIFMHDSYASYILAIASSGVCLSVCVSIHHTLQPYQNGAS